jgi:hypothetical protein
LSTDPSTYQHPATIAVIATAIAAGMLFGLAACESGRPPPAPATAPRPQAAAPIVPTADFGAEIPTAAARSVADWVVRTHDAGTAPFILIDKVAATIYVFGAEGRLRRAAPVLLGLAIGDETVPGIGERPIPDVLPQERTTPAGRFVGELGHDTRGEDVVWVDYDAAVSIHRVITSNPSEHRLERLQSPTVDDNRISYGCINVPREFYEAYVHPAFDNGRAIIYILPEVRPLNAVFALDRESN